MGNCTPFACATQAKDLGFPRKEKLINTQQIVLNHAICVKCIKMCFVQKVYNKYVVYKPIQRRQGEMLSATGGPIS